MQAIAGYYILIQRGSEGGGDHPRQAIAGYYILIQRGREGGGNHPRQAIAGYILYPHSKREGGGGTTPGKQLLIADHNCCVLILA